MKKGELHMYFKHYYLQIDMPLKEVSSGLKISKVTIRRYLSKKGAPHEYARLGVIQNLISLPKVFYPFIYLFL